MGSILGREAAAARAVAVAVAARVAARVEVVAVAALVEEVVGRARRLISAARAAEARAAEARDGGENV